MFQHGMTVFAGFTPFRTSDVRSSFANDVTTDQSDLHEVAACIVERFGRRRTLCYHRRRLDSLTASLADLWRGAGHLQGRADATIAALKPPKRQRPLIAIVGINDATETTDYLMPYGILRRADVADVVALATRPGPMTLFPVLKVEPDATTAQFDAQHPDGADYVIVPAMSRDDDPEVLALDQKPIGQGRDRRRRLRRRHGRRRNRTARRQAGDDALVFPERIARQASARRYVADRRIVVDRGVATTTGITASMPMSLTLIEAIAGRDKAEAVARDLGLTSWDARHASGAFTFTRPFALTAIRNTLTPTRNNSASGLCPASTKCRWRWSRMPGRAPIARVR